MNIHRQRSYAAITQKYAQLDNKSENTAKKTKQSKGAIASNSKHPMYNSNDYIPQDMLNWEAELRETHANAEAAKASRLSTIREGHEVALMPAAPPRLSASISKSDHTRGNSRKSINGIDKSSNRNHSRISSVPELSSHTSRSTGTVASLIDTPHSFASSSNNQLVDTTATASCSRSDSPYFGITFNELALSSAAHVTDSLSPIKRKEPLSRDQHVGIDAILDNIYPRSYRLRYMDADGEYFSNHVQVKNKDDDPLIVLQEFIAAESELEWFHQQLIHVDPAASNPRKIDSKLVVFTFHDNGEETRVRRLKDIPDGATVTVQLSKHAQRILSRQQRVSPKQERVRQHKQERDEEDYQYEDKPRRNKRKKQ